MTHERFIRNQNDTTCLPLLCLSWRMVQVLTGIHTCAQVTENLWWFYCWFHWWFHWWFCWWFHWWLYWWFH